MTWILFSVASYVAGAVPFGLLISRLAAGIDITRKGSGNIGATNVARELGLKWGLLTLLLDLLKGFVPVFVYILLRPNRELEQSLVALAALSGHQFSVFRHFRGGKGVSTALGIYLALDPASTLIASALFVIIVIVSDFISLGSMLAACTMPILFVLSGRSYWMITASLLMAGLICFKHRDNITRLIRGEERKWRERSASSASPKAGQAHHRNRNE